MPGFLKLFSKKCVCLFARLFVFQQPHKQTIIALSCKSSLYAKLKAKQSLYYTYAQVRVSSASKVGFFPISKTWCSNHSQTLRPAFLVDFSGILQLKNSIPGWLVQVKLQDAWLLEVSGSLTDVIDDKTTIKF